MDSSLQASSVTLFSLLAFLILMYSLFIISLHYIGKKTTSAGPPEPPGALPLIGHLHLLGGQTPIARTLAGMSDRSGPILSLKLGVHRALIVSNWELVKECFTVHDKNFATRPSIAAGTYLGYQNAVFALAPYGDYWREIRKISILEVLSSHRVQLHDHVRFSEITSFIKDLSLRCTNNRNKNNSPIQVGISKLIEHLTFNIIVRVIAGKRYTAKEYNEPNSEAWKIEKAINKATSLSGVFVTSDVLPYVEWMDVGGYVRSMKQTSKDIDSVLQNWLQEHIDKRRSNSDSGNDCRRETEDFMDKLLSILAEDTVISGHNRDTIIKATCVILVMTGSESTSITLTWCLALLMKNPQALKKAQEEMNIQVGRNKWVQGSDIKNLHYLQAIVKETLRLYPPSPMTGIREAMQDCQVAGFYIPKHTRVLANIWKLHRDPRVWPEPEEFRPERFLTWETEGDGRKFGYIPFSYGRRSCPGMYFGSHTVQLALAYLVQGFDMAAVGGEEVDMREGLGLALPKLTPLEVVLTPRLSSKLYDNL